MTDMHGASVVLTARTVPVNQYCHWKTEEL